MRCEAKVRSGAVTSCLAKEKPNASERPVAITAASVLESTIVISTVITTGERGAAACAKDSGRPSKGFPSFLHRCSPSLLAR